MTDYLDANRANWNDRAPLHAAGDTGYAVDRYVADRTRLSDVVAFDRPRLGDLSGIRAVHLQCHIGTDTLSLARLGADVVGLDFSNASIEAARALVARTGDAVTFVESDVYEAAGVLPPASFDLVYTGIGALCWLPSIERWAATVAALLAPGGRLFLREGHPVLWSIDDRRTDALTLGFPYFEQSEPLKWDDDSTYVDTPGTIASTTTYEWNHGLGEIVTALLGQGLVLTMLVEHDSAPWEALPGRMRERPDGEWELTATPPPAPLSYTLQAIRPVEAGAR
ncbi:class I SAM-dependent methyltransferase [Herbiconiux sp. P18]|uniref:class I SAM-dependent methyltransferase n=1 Tax=Herbiconiux liangxiaofengii TaxID=3342795 RepID=UPI0035B9A23E